MSSVVDVTVETFEGDLYQFPNVREDILRQALAKSLVDGAVLSLVNLSGSALVVLWPTVLRISFLDVEADAAEDAWCTLWESTTCIV